MRAFALALTLAAYPASAEEASNGTLPADPVKRAALLAGVAGFVESTCQTLRPDWKAVQIAEAANNFHAVALGKPPARRRDPAGSCHLAPHECEPLLRNDRCAVRAERGGR